MGSSKLIQDWSKICSHLKNGAKGAKRMEWFTQRNGFRIEAENLSFKERLRVDSLSEGKPNIRLGTFLDRLICELIFLNEFVL